MTDVEYDLENICRTCLTYSTDLESIFELCASTLPVQFSYNWNSLVMSIAKVEITLDDGMPYKICNLCKTAVHQAYLYKLKCEESDFKLRKYFQKKCQNLDIKEELQEFGFELQQSDLALDDDPFQHSVEVDVSIVAADTDVDDKKITTRRIKIIDDSVQCTICLKNVDKKTLSSHLKLHSNFKCVFCERTFAKQSHLNLHMQSHSKKEYRCGQCDEVFPNKKTQKVHESTAHSTAASKQSKRKSTQQLSTETVYVDATTSDFIQNKQENDIALDGDQEEQFEIVDGRYVCGKCDKSLVDKQTFKLHFRLHSGKNLKRCPICGQGFVKNNHLDRHVTLHYGSTFKCDHCDEMFENFKNFRLHTASHLSQTDKPSNQVQKGRLNSKTSEMTDESDRKKGNSRRLQCEICDKVFPKKSNLERHIKSHEKRTYPCSDCDDIFDSHKKRRLHMVAHVQRGGDMKRGRPSKQLQQLKHKLEPISTIYDPIFCSGPNGEKYCECKLCDKTFSKIAALNQHMVQHVNDIQSLAEIDFTEKLELFDGLNVDPTNQTNDSLIQLIHHQLSIGENHRFYQILNINSWELNLSDSETESESEMFLNSNSNSIQCYQCSKCDQNFNRSWKILIHMKDDHPNDEFDHKCTYCNRIYPNSMLLEKHLRSQCENTFKTFSCPMCGIKFMWKSSCDGHIEKMHSMETKNEKSKTFVCEICDKTFFRAEHLERHKKIHIPAEKKFSCDLCKKKFNRKDNLKSHMRVHKEDKDKEDGDKHLCVYCGRSFSNSSNLIVHMRRHTGEKPYKCDLCDKGFPRSSDLQCHRRTHTGEKPCLCTICGKGFSRSNKLVRHMRIHTGIRPYKCTYCDRAFTQSNDLTLHIRRHTGDKPYVCGICGDRFIQGTALQTHRRLQGHFEDNQPTPFASISVNNPNRYTNANRVNRIGTGQLNIEELIKQEKPTSSPSISSADTMDSASRSIDVTAPNVSTTLTSQVNRSSNTAYIQNGNTFLTMQTMVDIPPMLTISHFQGYN